MKPEPNQNSLKLKPRDIPKDDLGKGAANDSAIDNSAAKETRREVQLKQRSCASISSNDDRGEEVKFLLKDAHRVERSLEQRHRRFIFFRNFAITAAVIILSIGGTAGYAWYAGTMPSFPSLSYYLPFILSALLSGYFLYYAIEKLVRGQWIVHSLLSLIPGAALIWVNLYLLAFIADLDNQLPWQVDGDAEIYLSHQIHSVLSPGFQASLNALETREQMISRIRRTPTPEWRPLFERHLTEEEFSRLTVVNIERYLPIVVDRYLSRRTDRINDYERILEKGGKPVSWQHIAVSPYLLSWKWIQF